MGLFKIVKNRFNRNKSTPLKSKEVVKTEKQAIKKMRKSQKTNKYIAGMSKSSNSFGRSLKLLYNKHQIDETFFENLEEMLIMNDISMNIVMEISDAVRQEIALNKVNSSEQINEIIIDKMFLSYANQSHSSTALNINPSGLSIILMVGVNGVGKTTTIAKLAHMFIKQNKKVTVVAADTFRAGAVQQLNVWANRLNITCINPQKEQQDPPSVIYDGIIAAQNNQSDILICDTAGRLQNKVNLMNELNKIRRIIDKKAPNASVETLLVLDATTGQNGINQASVFKEVANVSGIVLTKMDGSSKGGIILTIKDRLDIDVKFLGLGEQLDDLAEFDLFEFVNALTTTLSA